MEHGVVVGSEDGWSRGTYCPVRYLWRMVLVHPGHSGHDGGIVCLLAHPASTLGGVHEQVLRGSGLSLPALQLQGYHRWRRGGVTSRGVILPKKTKKKKKLKLVYYGLCRYLLLIILFVFSRETVSIVVLFPQIPCPKI